VDSPGDPCLPLAGGHDLGEPLVDFDPKLEGGVGYPELLGRQPLPGVEAGIGQGHAGLLGEGPEKELHVLRRLLLRSDHEVARDATGAGQGVGPPPGLVRDLQRPPPRVAVQQLGFELLAVARPRAPVVDGPPTPIEVRALGVANRRPVPGYR